MNTPRRSLFLRISFSLDDPNTMIGFIKLTPRPRMDQSTF